MPRLNATHSQSYVIGGSGDRGGSELPRFERPVLKQAKSAYSSTTSPRPSSAGDSTVRSGMGFFRGRGGSGSSAREELPLTNTPSPSSGNGTGNNNNGSNNNNQTTSSSSSSRLRGKMRAAVSGRDAVLPDWSRTTPSPSSSFDRNRPRADSEMMHANQSPLTHSLSVSMPHVNHDDFDDSDDDDNRYLRRTSDSHQLSMMETQQASAGSSSTTSRVLRQRKPMEDYPSPSHAISAVTGRPPRQPGRAASSGSSGGGPPEDSPYRNHHHHHHHRNGSRSSFMRLLKSRMCGNLRGWTVGHFFQATVLLLVTFILYDSHHKANLIAQRLMEFKSEEAMVFLHLHRIEQQSLQLHESLQRLDEAQQEQGDETNNKQDGVGGGDKKKSNEKRLMNSNNAPHIDSALIQKQTQQLMSMEEELSNEVRTLQTRIQHSAVRSIVHEYGEGPVQVILEVVVDGQTSKISILLWHDTPHAAWTWLEQISRQLWDGATMHLENNRIMNIASVHPETESSHLDFVERSQQRHEAWTVGLTESTSAAGSGKGVAGLEIFINLQDNTEYSKHYVCVGKVFDGFDVLHKIVEQSRELERAGGAPITIRSARASHLTNRETKGLI